MFLAISSSGYPDAIPFDLLLIGLALLACLSPLLTFSRLWQLKEWRWDRLREHIKEDGGLRPLFGLIRPLILGLFGFLGLFRILPSWPLWTLSALAALTIIQIGARRQPFPVWTQKAKALVATALIIDAAVSYWLQATSWLVLLPLLQPFALALAWMIWRPVDQFLKQRILRRAAKLRAAFPDLRVIGITGSVGKTTTKELLAHILADKKPLVTPEHVNTEMGVAQWLIKELAIHNSQFAIVEMGAYRRGEIALLCRITKPSLGVLTHIGTQHVGLFGSPEQLRDAKAELIEALPEDGRAFLNGDNARCREVASRARCPVTLVGTGGHLDMEAFDIEETAAGIRFRVEQTVFDVPLHGTHNVTNVLLALAVGRHLGLTLPAMAERLRKFTATPKTFHVRHERGVTILDDTHNASEASMQAAITWAKLQPAIRKILVTPGLIEMGSLGLTVHRELGQLAMQSFDEAVFMNKKSAQQFAQGFKKKVTLFSKETPRIPAGTLLVCSGRMPPSVIERLLP